MGEEFKSEQSQISIVESEAAQKKADKLKQQLQSSHSLFFAEADSAGKIYSDATKSLSNPANKDALGKQKDVIKTSLGQVADNGRQILASENPEKADQYPAIASLAQTVQSTINKLKTDAPLYAAVEKTKTTYDAKLAPAMLKLADINDDPLLTPEKKVALITEAETAFGETQKNLQNINAGTIPPELKDQYDAVAKDLIKSNNDICQAKIDNMSEDDKKKNPDLLKIDAANQEFGNISPDVAKANALSEKIKDPKLSEEQYNNMVKEMLALADSNIEKLMPVKNNISQINVSELKPDAQLYLNTLSASLDASIKSMADIKIYGERKKMVDELNQRKDRAAYVTFTGTDDLNAGAGTESEYKTNDALFQRAVPNNYFKFNRDGSLEITNNFKKLSPEKQKAIMEQLSSGPTAKVFSEISDMSATKEDADFINAKKNLQKSDWRGAKQDLLKYVNSDRAKNPENAARAAECKELLSHVARNEVADAYQRLQSLRTAISVNGIPVGNSPGNHLSPTEDMGEETVLDRAGTDKAWDVVTMRRSRNKRVERYLEAQEAMLSKAMEMINSGQCLTFEEAEAKLRGSDIKKPEILTAQEKTMEDMNKKNPEAFHTDSVKSIQDQIDKAKDNPAQKADLEKKLATLQKEDPKKYYEAQKKVLADSIKTLATQYERDKTSQLLFRETDLPAELKDVYNVFSQQKNLNNPDPKVRAAYIERVSAVAREMQLPELAQNLLETYFEAELRESAKQITMAEVAAACNNNPEFQGKINEEVEAGIAMYEKEHPGQKVPSEYRSQLRARAKSDMVVLEYDRQVKHITNARMEKTTGARADLWKDSFASHFGNVQNIGANKIEFSDKEWAELPMKMAVQLVVMMAAGAVSGGFASGVAAEAVAAGMSPTMAGAMAFGVESSLFTSVQGGLDSLIHNEPGIFGSGHAYMSAWAEGTAVLGVIKGATAFSSLAGAGALTPAQQAAMRESYGATRGGALILVNSGERWLVRTNITGVALTATNAEMAARHGRTFTVKDGLQGFLDNIVLSAGMEAGHSLIRKNVPLPRRRALRATAKPGEAGRAGEVIPREAAKPAETPKDQGPYRTKAEVSERSDTTRAESPAERNRREAARAEQIETQIKARESALDSTTEVGKKVDTAIAGKKTEIEVKLPDGTTTKVEINVEKSLLTPETLHRLAQGEPLQLSPLDLHLHKHMGNGIHDAIKKHITENPTLETRRQELETAAATGDFEAMKRIMGETSAAKLKKALESAREKAEQGMDIFTRPHTDVNAEGKDVSNQPMSVTVEHKLNDFAEAHFKETGERVDPNLIKSLREKLIKSAIDQQIDNPPEYVSHGFDHSLRVMDHVDNVLKGNPKAVEGYAKKYKMSKAQARMMMSMVGIAHDFGYPMKGELNKSIHALTGTHHFLAEYAKSMAEAMGLDLTNPNHQKAIKNLANAIEKHSADKVEGTYEDSHGADKPLEFDSKVIVDIKVPGTDMTYKQELLLSRETLAGRDIHTYLQEYYKRLGIETASGPPYQVIPNPPTGQRYYGRHVDLPGTNKKGDVPAGVEFTGADLLPLPKGATKPSRHGDPTLPGLRYRHDPMLALIRYADNMDMAENRFSDFQKSKPFRRLYERIGSERSVSTPLGERSVPSALEGQLSSESFDVSKAQKTLKRASEGGSPTMTEGELLSLTKTLTKAKTEGERRQALQNLRNLVNSVDIVSYGQPPVKISAEYKQQILSQLENMITNAGSGPKDLYNSMKNTLIERVLTEESVGLDTTELQHLETVRKFAKTVNEVSFRHFGGCRPIGSVKVDGATMRIELKPDVVKQYKGYVANEKVSGHPNVDIPINVYQVWRGIDASQSLTVAGESMKIEIAVNVGREVKVFTFDPALVPDGKSVSSEFARRYKIWEATNI